MKKSIIAFVISGFLMMSCNSNPSLESYYVTNSENKNFIQVDVSPSVLNIDKSKLSTSETTALNSFNKMNILAFKGNDKNKAEYEAERLKVAAILKDEKYQQLTKFGSVQKSAQVSFIGTDDKISEFVLFAKSEEKGFAIVRVLGKDMNINSVMSLISILKNSNIDNESLKELKELL